MKVLLTGANGYIGSRLLPLLAEKGHHVVCGVRDKHRFSVPYSLLSNVTVIEVDFSNEQTLSNIPKDIDAAYYLIHSMTASGSDFDSIEKKCAENHLEILHEKHIKLEDNHNLVHTIIGRFVNDLSKQILHLIWTTYNS